MTMTCLRPDVARSACRMLGVALLAALAVGWSGATSRTAAQPAQRPESPSAGDTTVLLRIGGDDATASVIVPVIAKQYLEDHGAHTIRSYPAQPPWTTEITGDLLSGQRASILVRSSSSLDGFEQLANGDVDIALCARKLTAVELRRLGLKEDMSDMSAFVPLARAAIVLAVHPGNPVSAITFDQLKDIYAGRIRDWGLLGGEPGPIRVFGRLPGAASRDAFEINIMGGEPFGPEVAELGSFAAVNEAVAGDPGAIGYTPGGTIAKLKPVRLTTRTGHYSQPDDYGVATSDFPLELTLLLYRTFRANIEETGSFVRHARTPTTQIAAMMAGFSQIAPQLLVARFPESAPASYRDVVSNGLRVSVTIRFASGSDQLDLVAMHDLDVLARYLRSLHVSTEKLKHLAFSDDTGDPVQNTRISARLGTIVADELRKRHVHAGQVTSFGAEMPLASDAIPAGRSRNRRVETWILP
jgi:phosphate transport system substrate-binding protein